MAPCDQRCVFHRLPQASPASARIYIRASFNLEGDSRAPIRSKHCSEIMRWTTTRAFLNRRRVTGYAATSQNTRSAAPPRSSSLPGNRYSRIEWRRPAAGANRARAVLRKYSLTETKAMSED